MIINTGFFFHQVTVTNFRGYLGRKHFSFFPNTPNKSGLVVLGGPNGFGKTTLMDAIEWCITGQVKRLLNDFKARQETTENKQQGLIRNSQAKYKR